MLMCIGYLVGYLVPPIQSSLAIAIEVFIWLDFPISLLTMGLAMANHEVMALAWLFVVGTLWWYALSLGGRFVYNNFISRTYTA